MYKVIRQDVLIQRLSDGAFIPVVDGNRDYRDYVAWVAAGNTAQPPDQPPPPDTRRELVLEALQEIIDDGGTGPRLRKLCQALRALL